MTFRVMVGISAIWAGNARELKDGTITMPGTKYDVTEDVLGAAAVWDKNGNLTSYRCTQPKCENGEYYEEEDDGRESDLYGDEF